MVFCPIGLTGEMLPPKRHHPEARAIAEGKIVIVAVGWNSTLGVALDAIQGKGWNIGRYKVAIKYDNEKIYFLDPGVPKDAKELAWEFWNQFVEDWSQGNFAMESNSMWSISLEKP